MERERESEGEVKERNYLTLLIKCVEEFHLFLLHVFCLTFKILSIFKALFVFLLESDIFFLSLLSVLFSSFSFYPPLFSFIHYIFS